MTRVRDSWQVRFRKPFFLNGSSEQLPAGNYSVERQANGYANSMLRGRQSSTWMRVCEGHGLTGILKHIKIDPRDLVTALKLDKTQRQSGRCNITLSERALDRQALLRAEDEGMNAPPLPDPTSCGFSHALTRHAKSAAPS